MNTRARATGGARLTAWLGFVALLTFAAAYGRYAGETPAIDQPLYSERVAVGATIQFALFALVALGLAAGAVGTLFALRRPTRVGAAVAVAFGTFAVVLGIGAALRALGLDPTAEQGLIPQTWPPPEPAVFAANAVLVVLVGPFVEELLFRGVGYGVLQRFGPAVAVLGSAAAFALVHGLLQGFAIIFVLGIGLGIIRHVTGSVLPAFAFHGTFNGLQLAAAVALAAS